MDYTRAIPVVNILNGLTTTFSCSFNNPPPTKRGLFDTSTSLFLKNPPLNNINSDHFRLFKNKKPMIDVNKPMELESLLFRNKKPMIDVNEPMETD